MPERMAVTVAREFASYRIDLSDPCRIEGSEVLGRFVFSSSRKTISIERAVEVLIRVLRDMGVNYRVERSDFGVGSWSAVIMDA